MKRRAKLQTSKECSDAVGRALRRASKGRSQDRTHARHPDLYLEDGKVVAEKP